MTIPGKGPLNALLALGVVILLVANTLLPLPVFTNAPFSIVSTVLLLVGALLMALALLALGWTIFSPAPPEKLHTGGIYRYSRHPYYLGMMLGFLGLAFSSNNWLALVAVVVLVIPGFVLKALREERELREHFAEEWETYRSHSSFLIPWIW